jgi:hypothetical protein
MDLSQACRERPETIQVNKGVLLRKASYFYLGDLQIARPQQFIVRPYLAKEADRQPSRSKVGLLNSSQSKRWPASARLHQ